METAIQTKDLTKEYRQGKNIVMGVDHVNISVASGEFTSIVGRSGSGKSTLLHLLGGIDQPTAGSVLINGININQLQDAALTKFRSKHIGFIFQSYNLINELTVLEKRTKNPLPATMTHDWPHNRAHFLFQRMEHRRRLDGSFDYSHTHNRHTSNACLHSHYPGLAYPTKKHQTVYTGGEWGRGDNLSSVSPLSWGSFLFPSLSILNSIT